MVWSGEYNWEDQQENRLKEKNLEFNYIPTHYANCKMQKMVDHE